MSERTIPIEPYNKFDNLIELKGTIVIHGIEENIDMSIKKNLSLFNYSLQNGDIIDPRKYDFFEISVIPNWLKEHTIDDINQLLIKGENPEITVKLKIQVSCNNTKWCSHQESMSLSDIQHKKEVKFTIHFGDVKDEVTISAMVVRELENTKPESRKANSLYAILSNCEDLVIQIDERRDIGGSHLPIEPSKLHDLLFEISGMDGDIEMPTIKYSEDFKEYFVKDNLISVNTTFMFSMFFFMDSYLKWLIFKCRFDLNDKKHKSLLDTFSRHCGIPKSELLEIIQDDKFSKNQNEKYFDLSQKLIKGIQTDSSFKYVKELKTLIKLELDESNNK